jgi:hypothetical protein
VPKLSIVGRLFRITVVALALAGFLSLGGTASAGDREDAIALVGKWKYQGLLGDDFEYLANGKKLINGAKLDWTVKNGKLVEYNIFGKPAEYDFTLTPDGNTFRYNGNTYKRK